MNSSEQFPILRSIGRALPQNYYPQEMISAALWDEWGGSDESRARFDRLHRSVGVRGRHLAIPMEDYRALDSFAKMNDKWIERASDLGQQAIESALCQGGLEPTDIDHIFFTTVTGIASPSIDAKLINRMSMRADINGPRFLASDASVARPGSREPPIICAHFRLIPRCWSRSSCVR